MKKTILAVLASFVATVATAAPKQQTLLSPDGAVCITVNTDGGLAYTLAREGKVLICENPISMTLTDGTVWGTDAKPSKFIRNSGDKTIPSPVYKRAEVSDKYNELTVKYKEFSVVFRAYDDGMAYRFVSARKAPFQVRNEQAEFRFAGEADFVGSYVRSKGTFEQQFRNSFENLCTFGKVSEWDASRLAFLPLMTEVSGIKLCIAESDLLHYPGMFLNNSEGGNTLKGVFATYPKQTEQTSDFRAEVVTEREDYIAKCEAVTYFPWRIIGVFTEDRQLADNDLVFRLAAASDPEIDFSWVKPGKVAWDWWNDWNIAGVDFKAGINNDTYKYYIDFASQKGIEYVIFDEGWTVRGQSDLFKIIPEIDLPMLVKYAQERNVGIILWANNWSFSRDIEGVCKHFSEMGIKGFKVDFMDRDDQPMVEFHENVARIAAKYKLMIDFHGTYKPTGLHRTWPNVINFEGIHGLEQMKWSGPEVDQVTYDVTAPFIRFFAGPADYTQGAMRNATKGNYRPVNSEAMSQGTRCRQLAEYVVFSSPLNMLCDSPTNYLAEPECTKFIAEIPTVWDESVAIDGKVGDYVIIARRKGDVWDVGGMTDWDARDFDIDLSFLGDGQFNCTLYKDGVNADRIAKDFKIESSKVSGSLKVHAAPGGGFAAVITK